MKRITGIGGIFFNSPDPVTLRAWYKEHLGIDVQDWGGTAFTWTDAQGKPSAGLPFGPSATQKIITLLRVPRRLWSTIAWQIFTRWSRS